MTDNPRTGPHSTLDQPNIGKLTDGQLGKHGPLLKIYALTNFNDMRTRDKLWYKNNRDFQIGLLNALDAAQIPRTSLCAKSGHSIFTIGAGPQDSTVWHLGELIKVLLRLERRLTRVTPSAQTLSDAAVAVQKGPDSDLLQTPEALLAAKKPYQNVRSTQKKNTNWCAGTAQEQIAMFNDYFCWLLM